MVNVAKRLVPLVRLSTTSSTLTSRTPAATAVDGPCTPSKKRTSRKRGRPANGKSPLKTPNVPVPDLSKTTESDGASSTPDKAKVRAQRKEQSSKSEKQRKQTELCASKWQGLSTRRLRRMRVVEYDLSDLVKRTISFAILSGLDLPRDGLSFSLAIASAAGVSPPDTTHAKLIRATVRSAQQNLPTVVCVPDLAIETFLRLSSGAPPSVDAIETIASLCMEDPVLEHRAERAASLLRYVLAAKVKMDQSTLRPLFDLFVSSLDIKSASHMLRFFDIVCHDVSPIDRAYWYDHLGYAALLRQASDVTQLILHEKYNLGLPDTPFGKSVALSLDAENGRQDFAESTAHSMERCRIPIEPFARAALIRAAGRRNDIQSVWRHFRAFENDLNGCPQRYTATLSMPARQSTVSVNDYSGMTSRMQLADPTFAVFDALRICNKGEDAFELVVRLRNQYNMRFSKLIYEMVSQTCFRSNRLDLAIEFRKLLQAEKGKTGTISVQDTAV